MGSFQQSFKRLVRLALPIIGTALTNNIVIVIGVLMVSRLGHHALAASLLGISTFTMIMLASFGSLLSISILVSQAKAKCDYKHIRQIVQNGFILSLVFNILIVTLLFNSSWILRAFHQDPSLIAICTPFFHMVAFIMIPSLLSIVLQQFFIGISHSRVNLAFSLIKAPISILFQYLFIFGAAGFPKLGLAGLPSALMVSLTVVLVLQIFYIQRHPRYRRYHLFHRMKQAFDFVCFKKIASLGIPIGLQFSGEVAAGAVGGYFIGWFGLNGLAAIQIVRQFFTLFIVVMLGLMQALSVIVSMEHAREDVRGIRQAFITGLFVATIVAAIMGLIYWFFPDYLVSLFIPVNHNLVQPVVTYAELFFSVLIVTQFLDAWRDILSGTLRGLQETKLPMRAGIMFLWFISLPVSYLLAVVLNWGPIGVVVGFPTGILLCTLYLWYRLLKHPAYRVSRAG